MSTTNADSVAKPASVHLLLPRSRLIGREQEVADVQRLLLSEEVGLLTLTGPGGIGKTRLAMQVAATLLDHFVDGIYFVALAPIRDAALVISAIAQAVGVHELAGRPLQEILQDTLCARRMLLVLDNFEHVVTAAPLVGELVAACQQLKVLVTSRSTLHLYGEQEFPVPPLALPDPHRLTGGEGEIAPNLARVPAVMLFVQRAAAAKPDFVLNAGNAAAVADICIGLDGLPLAIELAAAKVKLLSPQALLARLQQRLVLLTGGAHDLPARQRTLRSEIAWSFDLLTPSEQVLFRRLAVFVGGFSLDAAQAVSNGAGDLRMDVLEGIASLVDQNLLRREQGPDSEPRFGMLETIREFGLEQLAAGGELEMLRRRHADYFLALSEAVEPELRGPNRRPWLARLEAENGNLRAALAWSQAAASPGADSGEDDGRRDHGVRMAAALTWFWFFGNHTREARGWFASILAARAIPQSDGEQGATAALAQALWGAGLMAIVESDYPAARMYLEESVAVGRQIGDRSTLAVSLRELDLLELYQGNLAAADRYSKEGIALGRETGSDWDLALALFNAGYIASALGDNVRASAAFQESQILFQKVQDEWGVALALSGLGLVASQQGDYATARAQLEASRRLWKNQSDKWSLGDVLCLLGEVLHRQGELERARDPYTECLLVSHDVGDRARTALMLHHFGALAQACEQYGDAARLFAASAAIRSRTSGTHWFTLTGNDDYERDISALRSRIGEAAFAAHWAAGQALSLAQAIELALGGYASDAPGPVPTPPDSSLPQPAPPAVPANLSTREVEVLRLLARGLSNAQIADKLVISSHTVNHHLTSIYTKLNVNSRHAASHFAHEHHLV